MKNGQLGKPLPETRCSRREIPAPAKSEGMTVDRRDRCFRPILHGLLKIAAGGVLTGILMSLLMPVIDKLGGLPGDFRIALVGVPFATLVFVLARRLSANPWGAAVAAAIVTMIAFVGAVNVAILVDGQVGGLGKASRNILAGLSGGFVGAGIMALGIALLLAGPRDFKAWLPMLISGTVTGALLALDSALDLDLTSVLYPVWQACVAVGLAQALRARLPRPAGAIAFADQAPGGT